MESYAELLKRYRLKSGISQRALAREIGLNPTLVNRSEAGDRPPSGTDEVAAISRALGLTTEERDRLLASAGHWPAVFLALGPGDETLRAVADALSSDALSDSAKTALRRAIDGLVAAVRAARDE
jgi:transcriptional regulator with XRE-family HTH domain